MTKKAEKTKKTKKTKRFIRTKDEAREELEQLNLSIDQNDLDKEWCKQPRLYHTYAIELAEARLREDEAEATFKAIKATLDGLIRSNPSAYDLEDKPKETAIASTIILQDEYMKAQKKVNDAQYKVSLLFAMTGSLDHKKAALENLVKLHGQDYFSTPRTDSYNRERMESERSNTVAKKCRKGKQK